MKVIRKSKSGFVLRFNRGEEYPAVFIKFLKKEKIRGGFFFGLGAFVNPEVAYYDIKKKKYLNRNLKGIFEVLSLVGNVAVLGRDIIIHNHVVLGKRDYSAVGGHLVEAEVGGTLEIFLTKTDPMDRAKDLKTGLNLLD